MEGPTSCRVTTTEVPSVQTSTVRVLRNDINSTTKNKKMTKATTSGITVGANMPPKTHRTTAFMPIARYLESSTANSVESGSQSQSGHSRSHPRVTSPLAQDEGYVSGITSKGSSSVASNASNGKPTLRPVLSPPHTPRTNTRTRRANSTHSTTDISHHSPIHSPSQSTKDTTSLEWEKGGGDSHTSAHSSSYQCNNSRLDTTQSRGVPHTDLKAYLRATSTNTTPTQTYDSPMDSREDGASTRSSASTTHRNRHHPYNTESTLVVLTVANQRRILLLRRNQKENETSSKSNVYLPFYQPVTHTDATPAHAAVRNLASATSLGIPLQRMNHGFVGSMYYSYIDNTTETIRGEIVYLYHIDIDTLHTVVDPMTSRSRSHSSVGLTTTKNSRKRRRKRESIAVDASKIQGPNDSSLPNGTTTTTTTTTTTLQWFDDWDHLPLHHMHPTDAIWLSTLLEGMEDSMYRITFDAWFQCTVSSSRTRKNNNTRSPSPNTHHSERSCTYHTCLERSNTTRILHSFLSMTDPTIEADDDWDTTNTKEPVVVYNHTPSTVVSSQTTTPVKATVKPYVTTSTPKKTPSALPIHATVTSQTPKVKRRSSLGSDSVPTRATVQSTLTSSKPKTTSTSTSPSNLPAKMTLEKRLFHALHNHKHDNDNDPSSPPTPKPSIKEFKEAWAFANTTRSFYSMHTSSSKPSKPSSPPPIDLVLDVAGGHGALAALFLALTPAQRAVVIDPAQVGGGGIQQRWGEFFRGKRLEYRHECLRTGLRAEIESALRGTKGRRTTEEYGDDGGGLDPRRILVVACHACQHLTDETMEIACSYGVHVAVMPCCQKDNTNGSSLKEFAKQMGIEIGLLMDILAAGKVMSWNVGTDHAVRYQVRMKTIDKNITPQNRLILCKACDRESHDAEAKRTDEAHARLETAYRKAHGSVKLREHDEELKHVAQEHREQGGIGLSMMRFARRVLYKSSQEGTSTMEQCKSIRKDLKQSKASASSASDTLFWKNLRLLSLLQLTRNTKVDKSVSIGVEDVEDVGNPIHGISAVRHIQDSLSTETMATAGILFCGSIVSVLLANSSSTRQR